MLSKKATKIICIVLAALMILSCVAVLAGVFGIDMRTPVTGDNDLDYIIPIIVILLAVVAVVLCIVIPRVKKKSKKAKKNAD